MNGTLKLGTRPLLCLFALFALATSSLAASVKVWVQGGHDTYTAYLFKTGDRLPTATIANFSIAGGREVKFSVSGNARYFIRVVRNYDGYTRQTTDGYVGGWAWNTLNLGTLSMW